MTATCPACSAPQVDGLACHVCTLLLEQALGDVAAVVRELDVALSKQAKLGVPGGAGGKGWAHEKTPANLGAMNAGLHLRDILVSWARDVSNEAWHPTDKDLAVQGGLIRSASRLLLSSIPEIRRHAAVDDLISEVTEAVEQARRAVDRPADRQYLGQCMGAFPDENGQGVTCYAEIWAKPDAHEVQCRVCGITHEVAERRDGLLERAGHLIVTVKQAAEYMGEVGGVTVNAKTIRAWIDRDKLTDRSGGVGERTIRLGDLFTLVAEKSEGKAAA